MLIGAKIGSAIGAVFSSVVNGLLCSYAGWEWAFYVPGIMGMTWCITYFFAVHTDIDTHPRMSQVSSTHQTIIIMSFLFAPRQKRIT